MTSFAPSPRGAPPLFFDPQNHDRIRREKFITRPLQQPPARPMSISSTATRMASSSPSGARSLDTDSQELVEITAWQKMISATSGSLVSGLISTPLDVVRVRWQAQGLVNPLPPPPTAFPTSSSAAAVSAPNVFRPANLGITACCREVFFNNNHLETCMAAESPRVGAPLGATTTTTSPEQCAAEHHRQRTFNSTLDGLRKIARHEGVTTLWRGLSPTLMMAIPGNIIYFTGYEWLRADSRSPIRRGFSDDYAPLVAGATARILAATTVGPIELFRTRMQAAPHGGGLPGSSSTTAGGAAGAAGAGAAGRGTGRSRIVADTFRGIRDMVGVSGYTALWRGLTLTMWRDVPFSGLYWWGYEFVRGKLTDLREGAGSRRPLMGGSRIEEERRRSRSIGGSSSSNSNSNSSNSNSNSSNSNSSSSSSRNSRNSSEGHLSDAIWHNSSEDRYRARRYSQSHENHAETFTDAFVAGALSGAFASLVTTPFDVGKTRTQVYRDAPVGGASPPPPPPPPVSSSTAAATSTTTTTTTTTTIASTTERIPSRLSSPAAAATAAGRPEERGMVQLLWHIVRHEGLSGLFKGVIPRMLKVAPACAIMISSYEVGKRSFRSQNERAALRLRERDMGGD